ncbi:MAG TPA: 5-formyltetrahydrofolate cyclo-ligase [Candidatus Paceibacterota bacterium]|nr:5-formyltetrahydrofolate cyclo-ligase [Candidatus Paceibacterota bacterium]
MAQTNQAEGKEKGSDKTALEKALAACDALITYVPLRTEVRFEDYFPLPEGKTIYQIAPRAALDPFAEAKNAIAAVGDKKTAVLMPGRAFDAAGTRFGQGGGWYDRFLSAVPTEWLRIGFCFDRQFSPTPLQREEWDQVMDYVCVAHGQELEVFETKGRMV